MDKRGSYTPFDLAHPPSGYEELARELAGRPKDAPVTTDDFTTLTALIASGFRSVCYESQKLRTADGTYLYWITGEHAAALGAALTRDLDAFRLDLTTGEEGAFDALVGAVPAEVRIGELTVSHRSGDEVTVAEARAWVRLVSQHDVRSFHLWAAEYAPEALDAFCRDVLAAAPTQLAAVDVCDLTRAEPDDRIALPALDVLLATNARRTPPLG